MKRSARGAYLPPDATRRKRLPRAFLNRLDAGSPPVVSSERTWRPAYEVVDEHPDRQRQEPLLDAGKAGDRGDTDMFGVRNEASSKTDG
jgi:hypothetical protein